LGKNPGFDGTVGQRRKHSLRHRKETDRDAHFNPYISWSGLVLNLFDMVEFFLYDRGKGGWVRGCGLILLVTAER
jgi:hypothetical protein